MIGASEMAEMEAEKLGAAGNVSPAIHSDAPSADGIVYDTPEAAIHEGMRRLAVVRSEQREAAEMEAEAHRLMEDAGQRELEVIAEIDRAWDALRNADA